MRGPSQVRIRRQDPRRDLTATKAGRKPPPATTSSGRESIESFVVVFLAFLIWSIEAEGFVIPTGSMAPTLMGRHKDVVCPQCGYSYTVNADREVELTGKAPGAGRRIKSGVCENCRFEAAVDDSPSFSGDRIYVVKHGLSLPFVAGGHPSGPKRWDVAVFKLPEEPEIRYIKRLVGMPNEVIRIDRGDIWGKPLESSSEFERLRRSLDHQQAMQLMVYDDSHRAAALRGDPRWSRWSGDWKESSPGTYAPPEKTSEWSGLRYHHLVASPGQWEAIRAGRLPTSPRASLITDFCSYNTDLTIDDHENPSHTTRAWFQPHWVGDLTLALRLTVKERCGRLRLELVKAGISNRCEIDLASGEATLYHGNESVARIISTAILRAPTLELVFANVDDRLTLGVNGSLPFGDGVAYASDPSTTAPTAEDLEPVRIAARDSVVEVSSLVLKRDLYYTLTPSVTDYADLGGTAQYDSAALFDLLADPVQFPRLEHRAAQDYAVKPGNYLMLGDNSPWSRDGRAWGRMDQIDPNLPGRGWDSSGRSSWEVPESLLVGKAFCVYWPHPKPVWPNLNFGPDIRLPILPYVEKMRWIR
jgi:Signal peptidase, peptidase S26